MKIEIWSDILCPFCYLGKQQLELAIEKVGFTKEVEITYRSYQLNPEAKYQEGLNMNDYLIKQRGYSESELAKSHNHLIEKGQEVGITYNFDTVKICNSINAHAFLHFAEKHNKASKLYKRLFELYFVEGANIESVEILTTACNDIGLDINNLIALPHQDADIIQDIEKDQYMAQQIGARGVPYFLFNEKFSLSGAHGVEVFSNVLKTVYQREQNETQL